MTEPYSKTPPTVAEWRWVKDATGSESVLFHMAYEGGLDNHWCTDTGFATSDELLSKGYEFGPAIPSAEELAALRQIVSMLPQTKDGKPVVRGMTIWCPLGHPIEVLPCSSMGGGSYCCKGKCWSDGCQGDSGSGTRYDASECFATEEAALK